MDVRELMTKDPEVCEPTDTLDVAGEVMHRRRCGFIPVVANRASRKVIGVLTDRDIALFLTRTNVPAKQAAVQACMTKNPKTIAPDADLTEAAQIMERYAVHRLPVVENERLIGVLSLKDIALTARKEWGGTGIHVAEQQMKEIVEGIAAAQSIKRE